MERYWEAVLDQILGLCPACGAASPGVCAKCWSAWKREGPFVLRAQPFSQRSLRRWDESNEKSIQRLVLSMKVRPRATTLRLWARELSLALAAEWGPSEFLIVHPPGRSRRRERDHAGGLAAAVAECLRVQLGPELIRVQERRSWGQKRAGRDARRELQFAATATGWKREKPIVFIDDVLTSGATAEAAWRALGEPAQFQAWSIFGRDRLDSEEGSG
jgi:predicted amidophosphoribosyltransferase